MAEKSSYPRTLAEKRIKLVIMSVKPKNLKAPTIAELNAGIDASCRIAASDFRLTPTASSTISDGALCEGAEIQVPGSSQYEANITPFRIFDPEKPDRADSVGDAVFQALKVKGTTVWLAKRHTGKRYDDPWEVGGELEVYEAITDDRQDPSDLNSGYIKKIIPLLVQNAELDAVVAANTGG